MIDDLSGGWEDLNFVEVAPKDNRESFRNELEILINRYSMENTSNTPDFVLAGYLFQCLDIFDSTITMRDKYYGITTTGTGATISKSEC